MRVRRPLGAKPQPSKSHPWCVVGRAAYFRTRAQATSWARVINIAYNRKKVWVAKVVGGVNDK